MLVSRLTIPQIRSSSLQLPDSQLVYDIFVLLINNFDIIWISQASAIITISCIVSRFTALTHLKFPQKSK
nr:MAG TPA: hypothetical protein [Caudoviricetes sp.]